MFGGSYFGHRYFGPRYWGEGGTPPQFAEPYCVERTTIYQPGSEAERTHQPGAERYHTYKPNAEATTVVCD